MKQTPFNGEPKHFESEGLPKNDGDSSFVSWVRKLNDDNVLFRVMGSPVSSTTVM